MTLRRWLCALALVGGSWMGVAGAQPAPAPAASASAETTDAAEREKRLEALRYRNLWIAYGAIWLLVFGFTYRTWRRGEDTTAALDDLKRRLADLEAKNG